MRTYAVAYVNFHENDLRLKIVIAANNESWKDALETAFPGTTDTLDDYIETAKEQAFNQDWLFAVVPVQERRIPIPKEGE